MPCLKTTKLYTNKKLNIMKNTSKNKFNATIGNTLLGEVNLPYFEEYYKDKIESGLIDKDGKPLKCECGNTDFERVNCYYEESVGLVEYSLECKNEECLKIVGNWSYGAWDI